MAQTARRMVAKDPVEKLAHRRMTVLELAGRLGNVTEAGKPRTNANDAKKQLNSIAWPMTISSSRLVLRTLPKKWCT